MAFPLFQRLPLELRLKIWQNAIPNGVYISFRGPETKNESQHIISRCSDHTVPPLLHVNSEARAVSLQHLRLLGAGSSRAYFNPALDKLILTIVLSIDFYALSQSLGPNISLVRHVAYSQAGDGIGWFTDPRFVKAFEGLESFTFLDLTEWEDLFFPSWEAMRGALGSGSFRADDLVEADMSEAWQQNSVPTLLCRSAMTVWSEGRDREERSLEVAIVSLPVPEVTRKEVRRKREVEWMKKILDEDRKTGWFWVWGYLVALLARMRLVKQREAADWYDIENNRPQI